MHTSNEELKEIREKALERISIGDHYYHYKNPDDLYEITDVGFQESDESVIIAYTALYGHGFTWYRQIDDFFGEKTLEDGTVVQKFVKVDYEK